MVLLTCFSHRIHRYRFQLEIHVSEVRQPILESDFLVHAKLIIDCRHNRIAAASNVISMTFMHATRLLLSPRRFPQSSFILAPRTNRLVHEFIRSNNHQEFIHQFSFTSRQRDHVVLKEHDDSQDPYFERHK